MPTRTGGSSANSLQSEMGDRIRANASSKEEQARKLLEEAQGLNTRASEQDKADDARDAKVAMLASKIIPAEVDSLMNRFGSNQLLAKLRNEEPDRTDAGSVWDSRNKGYVSDQDIADAKRVSSEGKAALTTYLGMKPNQINLFGGLRQYGSAGGESNLSEILKRLEKAPLEVKAAAEAFLVGQMVIQTGKQHDASRERDRANTRKKDNQGNADYSTYHKKEYNAESSRIRAEHARLICEKAIRILNGDKGAYLGGNQYS